MLTHKILVADSNTEIRSIISVLLNSENCVVIEANDGAEAIQKANEDIDLFILDIMMPYIDGYQVCKKIREKSKAPILLLSDRGAESDKTLGFSCGADDYLMKPFCYSELTARVKAMLRRYHIYQGKEKRENKIITLGALTIYVEEERVMIDNHEVELTVKEFEILSLLAKKPGFIFSIEYIYKTVWKEEYYHCANNAITVHMCNLRKKIETNPEKPKIIKNIWGKGYRIEYTK